MKSSSAKEKKVSELIEYENLSIFTSPRQNYRARAEFRIWHDGDICNYAMTNMIKTELSQ